MTTTQPAVGTQSAAAKPARPPRRHPWTWQRALKLLPILVLILIAVTGPSWVPFDPQSVIGNSSVPPNGTYFFGTDSSGLDVFSRTIVATRTNLIIAFTVAFIATLLGCVGGLAIAMKESSRGVLGYLARGASRVVDLAEAIPAVLIGLVVVSFFGATVPTLIVALSIILAPIQVRLVRTEVLRVRSESYLDAARMAGLSEYELTVRHVLPNSTWAAVQNASVIFAVSIIVTAALGFIGVGLPPPAPEWGSMLASSAGDVTSGRWWAATFPAAALFAAVAAVSLASHALFGRRSAR